MNKIIDGKRVATELNKNLKTKINSIYDIIHIRPKLATIQVGDDPASDIYIRIKERMCNEIGIEPLIIHLDKNISPTQLFDHIENLNQDASVHGILLQLPLPSQLAKFTTEFIYKISHDKDVDGLHPFNKGKLFDYQETLAPCTPKGIIALTEYYQIELSGKHVVLINRSNLVGKPLIFMLLKRNATITVCHSYTSILDEHTTRADILIVAVGIPNFITKEKIKEGSIVFDVGINRIDGKLCGDVDFEDVLPKCSKITPVPGGVGPMTVASLMENTYRAYSSQLKKRGIEIEKIKKIK